MKVLLIDNSVDTTGASKSLLNTIKEIRSKEGINCAFIHPKGSKRTKVIIENGFTAYELPFTEIRKSLWNIIMYFPYLLYNSWQVARIAKKERAQVIHVNDLYNLAGIGSKIFHRVKVITHIRRMPESFPLVFYKTWAHIQVRFADRIIAVSKANKDAMPRNNKTVVVYNPLPDPERHPVYIPRPYLEKFAKVLYMANYNYGKGHAHAIKMMSLAVKAFPDWNFQLNIHGGDFGLEKNRENKRELENLVAELGLSDTVLFHNKVSDVEKLMKEHDLVLNFSDSESFSRLTLESLFFGLPIIATDVGGTREMLIDGKGGFLVERKNVNDMFSAFRKLILDDAMRVSFSSFSYAFVRSQFSIDKTSEKVRIIYQDLIGNNNSIDALKVVSIPTDEQLNNL